jgi:NADH:ubiquinone oxidoreductase subunit 3 (subunit A)
MKSSLLVWPPIAFAVYLLLIWTISRLSSGLAAKQSKAAGKDLPYACGEEFAGEKAEPEYGDFFPFAIFFTMMHVAVLMLATLAIAPSLASYLGSGIVYLVVVSLTLAILFVG